MINVNYLCLCYVYSRTNLQHLVNDKIVVWIYMYHKHGYVRMCLHVRYIIHMYIHVQYPDTCVCILLNACFNVRIYPFMAIWQFGVITHVAIRIAPADTYVSLCISILNAIILKSLCPQRYSYQDNQCFHGLLHLLYNCVKNFENYELKCNLRVNKQLSLFLRKALVRDRMAKDDCLLVFVPWHGNTCVFMCMHDTVSLKNRQKIKVCY